MWNFNWIDFYRLVGQIIIINLKPLPHLATAVFNEVLFGKGPTSVNPIALRKAKIAYTVTFLSAIGLS